MLIAERFIASLIDKYGKHPILTDGGTWYPQVLPVFETGSPYPFLL